MRVLVLGGYGNFGAVICRALAGIPGVTVLVGGRDAARAGELAAALGGEAAVIDRDDAMLAERVAAVRCDWVVHAAGPFQGASYDVARACIEAGSGFVDIADARAFVCGIDIGIVSSSRLPGRATVMGVLGYCGRPFEVWRGGRWTRAHGWQRPRRHAFHAAPFSRWIADCDMPDLSLLPGRFPSASSVTFGAGAGSPLAQAALFAASWWGRMSPLPATFVGGLHRLGRMLTRFGPTRSAMFVELRGRGSDHRPLEVSWELVAEDHQGRYVPCMGAVAVIRKALGATLGPPGAGACTGVVGLAELRGLPVATAVRRRG